ncbi:hypothetical protein T492DRAFT_880192, partial [Pavlovales sp. CCMP2436]
AGNLARLKKALVISSFDPHGNFETHHICLAKAFSVSEYFISDAHSKAIAVRQAPTVQMSKSVFLLQSTALQKVVRERIVVPVDVGSAMTHKAYFDKLPNTSVLTLTQV